MTTNIKIYNSRVTIISQEKTNVKCKSNAPATEKWAQKKPLADKIAQRLYLLGYERRAQRMADCSDYLEYKYCADCDRYMVQRANLCRDRLCPICNWRLSLQRYSAMTRIIDTIGSAYPEASYSLITLTVRNCAPQALSKTIDRMADAWHLVINQRGLKPLLLGTARSVELTYNARTRQLHPHYHVLVAWYNKATTDNAAMMIDYWLRACRKYNLVVDIKAQHAADVTSADGQEYERAVLETYKYAIKSKTLTDMPQEVLAEVVKQWAGKRLVSMTGKFKQYAKDTQAESMEEVANDVIQISPCKCCGSNNTHVYAYRWAFGENAYVPCLQGDNGGVTPPYKKIIIDNRGGSDEQKDN